MEPTSTLGPHPRRGFYLAIALGILSLAYIFLAPVPGLIYVALYFLIAWGIRHRRPGAALMGLATFLVSLILYAAPMFDGIRREELIARLLICVFPAIFAALMLRAWLDLRRDPARTGVDWPWLVFPLGQGLFWICLGAYSMPSASMTGTILPGDLVLVNTIGARMGHVPQRDEIVVFRYPLNPQEIYVKRVAGIPGDRLRVIHKQLYRNGSPVAEPYALHGSTFEDSYRDNFPAAPNSPLPEPAMKMLESAAGGELIVPQGKYFVLGDNRDDSADSRYWGFVDRSEFIGRPFLIYASYEWKDPAVVNQLRSVLNLRWNRVMKWL